MTEQRTVIEPTGVKHEFMQRARDNDTCHLCLMPRNHPDHQLLGEAASSEQHE